MTYRPRVVDSELQELLGTTGAIVLEGAKASGKTATARQVAKSEVQLDVDPAALAAASVDPTIVLAGDRPRLIDEWQLEPSIWNHVRRAVDEHPDQPGQFILTGSATPSDDATRHVGALRMTRMRMRPMTLFETDMSTGEVSLADLLAGDAPSSGDPGYSVADIAEAVAVGGWPGLADRTPRQSVRALRGYLEETARVDINRVDGIRRDPAGVDRVIRSLARNVGTSAPLSTIAADAGGDVGVSRETVGNYLDALGRLMIVEDVPAWAPHIRSRSRLRSTPTRHFVDPSLAVAALDATPERLLRDIRWFGFLFESLVIRDLRVYAQGAGGTVFHYRDEKDLEVDAIVEFDDGRWAAFEVKLGAAMVEEAARDLLRLASKVDQDVAGPPAALGVIAATGYAYKRDDGVAVMPITALAP